jgi:hypothetical protein
VRPNLTLRFSGSESILTIVESDKIGQIFVDDSHRIILIVDSLREAVGAYGIKSDPLRNNFACKEGSCIEYGHSHRVILREMAIRYAHIEGVRLLVEVQPVIWSDP